MKEKHNMLTMVIIIGLIIALIIVSLSNRPVVNVGEGAGVQKDTLSVSGNAELTVEPDQAVLYVTVLTEGKTAKEAQDQNKANANSVIRALILQGISDKDIETSTYNLRKKTEWDPVTRKNVDKGYMLTHTLKVTTTKIDKAGNLVDTAINAGANGVDMISFGLTKETEKKVRAEALEKASEAAKEKAESIAKSLNLRLGKITSIQESNVYYASYDYAPKAVGIEMAGETQIQPQKVDVTSSISLVFEIN